MLVKISRWLKDKRSFTQHITIGEADHEGDDQAITSLGASVFDRLQPSTPHQRPSVFKRMGGGKTPKLSVFQRMQGSK